MVIDDIIHQFHTSAEAVYGIAQRAADERSRNELLVKARFEAQLARHLLNGTRYWLDIREVERFRGARFRHDAFPPMVHDSIFVEFNGVLKFDFRAWQRDDLIIYDDSGHISQEPQHLKPNPFHKEMPETFYKAVFVKKFDPPHKYLNWPDETVIRVYWFEKPKWVQVPPEQGVNNTNTFPLADNYTVSFCRSSWPRLLDSLNVRARDDQEHPGESAHSDRLFHTTVNLLYFLASENVVRVKIKPEHHRRDDLKGLPKSDRDYYVLPFQLPRYRYLHPEHAEPTGRHVSVCHDVRGHFRHLLNDRYERNEDGTARVIWIDPHQRGLGQPYRPAVRRGEIASMFLDYDKFIREEYARVNRKMRRKIA